MSASRRVPSARVLSSTPRNLSRLAARLRAGDLVAVPTETVYGLAADATDPRACKRIFEAKDRPMSDPLIVHIAGIADLSAIAFPNEAALALARRFWPGPLTMVLPKTGRIPDEATAGRPSVAVRMPSHPVFRRLIRLAARPLAAPSANPFGYVSPTTAEHVRQGLGSRIRWILDGGPSRIGIESTILDLRNPLRPVLLRPGSISRSELARALGRPVAVAKKRAAHVNVPVQAGTAPGEIDARESDQAAIGPGDLAPGMRSRHYSPRTPVRLHARLSARTAARGAPDEAWLFLRKPAGQTAPNVFWLDARGRLAGAARTLFATLRRLDSGAFSRIHVERARSGPLADALNDRLARAAARG